METRAIVLLIVPVVLASASAAPAPSSAPATSAPASAPATSAATAPAARSVWDGVYTADQLDRGKKAYNSSCARCHGDSLLGNDDAPALVGKDFLTKWSGKSVGEVVQLTYKTMPSDGPGKLSRKQSADMVAYILNSNDFPVGKTELPPDADTLNTILIQAKK